jgi:hypothetical protein
VGSDPIYSQRLSSDGWLDHEGVAQTHRRGKPTIDKLALEKLSSLRTDLWFGVPEHTVYCMTSPIHLSSVNLWDDPSNGCTRLQLRL